jgi:cobalt-zinc-cadmium efflux system protein
MEQHQDHNHQPKSYTKAFAIGVILNLCFVVIEAWYGYGAKSLALLADAGHNLSDVFGLLLAWGGSWLATRKPDGKYTYGFRSSSIHAALINAVILLFAVGGILWESYRRFKSPVAVEGGTVMFVAGVGIVVNAVTAWLFMSGRKSDLNLKGAYMHMAADALVSVGVVVTGALILYTGAQWLDPVVSAVVAIIIAFGTWGLLRDSVNLALAAAPTGIELQAVEAYLKNQKGVREVHDLHVWGMSTSETALTVHLVIPGGHPGDTFIASLCDELNQKFQIHHATVQIEIADSNIKCRLEPKDMV